ncbi:winged helix DNA-binding domain-containing protein [Nocardioides alcanivorans]|uniref:winged helix DNA-binding domain-containing protein n=1 Tax=Nocardioides alcanivorans TaxID=2897352 RepID=UPI001F48B890|nr:winged helix DNA-binding domain-containing protein [Nocardioides alcanivorans]
MLHISDAERRRRIRARHGIDPAHRRPDIETAVGDMTVLHATDSSTVHLSLLARVDAVTVADVDDALHGRRSVVRQLAMRRTLFGVPRDLLGDVVGSAGARLVTQQRNALVKDVERCGLARDGTMWLRDAESAVNEFLAGGGQFTAAELRKQVPAVAGMLHMAPGKSYGGEVPVAPRVLTVLSAAGDVVRARQTHHWRLNKPTWASMTEWLGEPLVANESAAGYATLVERWLRTFAPGTEDDIVWWLGATKAAVRRALTDLGAVPVSLDDGGTGWVLPDDLDETPEGDTWVALLPALDPTVMGWKQRDFLLGGLVEPLFDGRGTPAPRPGSTLARWDAGSKAPVARCGSPIWSTCPPRHAGRSRLRGSGSQRGATGSR